MNEKSTIIVPAAEIARGEIVRVPHGKIAPSSLNPRTHFDRQKLDELKQSFAAHGFTAAVSHLLVRPIQYRIVEPTICNSFHIQRLAGKEWEPVSVPIGNRMTDGDARKAIEGLPAFELICGERRWRAAGELIEDGKLPADVPAVVEDMPDAQALELQLVENLQRDELTPLEEAEGLRQMLELKGEDGKPLHTVKSLASKIGRSMQHVGERLSIAKLRGTPAGDALDSGELPISHARLLARLPAGKTLNDMTRRVLKPADGLAPIPYKVLERIIRDECMISLRGVSFDLADADLVPVVVDEKSGRRAMGGACNDCPFNSRNSESADERASTGVMCLHPECFRAKSERAHAVWVAKVSDPATRRTALGVDEAERVFDHTGKRLQWNSGFVDLDAAPDDKDLRNPGGRAPEWRKLLRGTGVPLVLAKDADGKVHELVERSLALEAVAEAEKEKPAGERVLRAGAVAAIKVKPELWPEQKDEQSKQRVLAEKAAAVRRERLTQAEFSAVMQAARGPKVPDGFWRLAVDALVDVTEEHGDAPAVASRLGLSDGTSGASELRRYAQRIEVPDQVAFVVSMLLTFYRSEEGLAEILPRWGRAFGADLKGARKRASDELEAQAEAERKKAAVSSCLVEPTSGAREAAADYTWNSHGVCENEYVVTVRFPKGGKAKAEVRMGRSAKGWHVGYSAGIGVEGSSAPCSRTATAYGSRKLALRSGLLAVAERLASFGARSEDIDLVSAQIAQIEEPAAVATKRKPAKQAAAKKPAKAA